MGLGRTHDHSLEDGNDGLGVHHTLEHTSKLGQSLRDQAALSPQHGPPDMDHLDLAVLCKGVWV